MNYTKNNKHTHSETSSILKAAVGSDSDQAPVVPAPGSRTIESRFITAYGRKIKVKLAPGSEPGAKQSFKDECDINILMSRYQKTGIIENLNKGVPRYGDLIGLDFQSAMETVATARSSFERLPAKIREEFANNPQFFLEFVQNPENASELTRMGLLRPGDARSTPPSQPVAPAQPTPQATPPGGTPAPPEPTPK